jgi:hypothetical protein
MGKGYVWCCADTAILYSYPYLCHVLLLTPLLGVHKSIVGFAELLLGCRLGSEDQVDRLKPSARAIQELKFTKSGTA